MDILENSIEMQFSFGLTPLPFWRETKEKRGLIFKFIGAPASFTHLGSPTGRKVGGSGVGVALARHLIMRLNGGDTKQLPHLNGSYRAAYTTCGADRKWARQGETKRGR